MQQKYNKWVFLLLALGMGLSACSTVKPREKNKSEKSDGDLEIDSDGQTGGGDLSTQNGSASAGIVGDVDVEAASLAAFEEFIFPVVDDNCSRCHGAGQAPFFAKDGPTSSHNAALDRNLMNSDDPDKSRFVQKILSNHNCWSNSCEDDADEMLEAIQEWAKAVNAAKDKSDDEIPEIKTIPRTFGDNDVPVEEGPPLATANQAAIVAPFQIQNDDPDGVSGSYIVSNQGGNNADPNNAVTATFTIDVPTAGTYQVFGRVKAPGGGANSFYIQVDGGASQRWDLDPNMPDNWVWQPAGDQNFVAYTYNLTAGPHTIVIRQREAGSRLAAIGIAENAAVFNGEGTGTSAYTLTFDLEDLVDAEARIILDGVEHNAEKSVIRFQNLRVETDEPLIIKGIKILINGSFDPKNATYTLIDTTVQAPGGQLSNAAMIAAGENGFLEDEISLQFDTLEVDD